MQVPHSLKAAAAHSHASAPAITKLAPARFQARQSQVRLLYHKAKVPPEQKTTSPTATIKGAGRGGVTTAVSIVVLRGEPARPPLITENRSRKHKPASKTKSGLALFTTSGTLGNLPHEQRKMILRLLMSPTPVRRQVREIT